ncbi:ORF80 [Agrotis segetum granulovirus]|uniref:ORF80 n=1 Tax=Agrotis segetum granulosis virus TaxID=10464 RepID=Q6QXN0_GVAS|nr:p14.2 [Agrotis segetum granulovirus]AAS82659.1 ORF80 [Agrotis segetum granulovirus]AKN63368.1 p14.2 [Agrotis segetum granulovirus]
MVPFTNVIFVNAPIKRLNIALETMVNVNLTNTVTARLIVTVSNEKHIVISDHNFVVGTKVFFGSIFLVCKLKFGAVCNTL